MRSKEEKETKMGKGKYKNTLGGEEERITWGRKKRKKKVWEKKETKIVCCKVNFYSCFCSVQPKIWFYSKLKGVKNE